MTDLCRNFKLFNNSQLKEHADAGFDEVKFWNWEVTEGEQVQILSVDIVSRRAGCFLNGKHNVVCKLFEYIWADKHKEGIGCVRKMIIHSVHINTYQ